jgi:hypothetical protein
VPSRGLYERRLGRVSSRGFSAMSLLFIGDFLDFRVRRFSVDFSVLPCSECQMAGRASRRTSCLNRCAMARQVELARICWQMFYVFLKGFKFVDLSICLSTFPFLRDRSARWLDSRLRGPRFSLFVRRRGRLNPRKILGDFLLVGGGLVDFALVDFRVLPRPQCQLIGLASPRDVVLVFMSDGEAGVTLVVFLAYSVSESVDCYDFVIFRLFMLRRS